MYDAHLVSSVATTVWIRSPVFGESFNLVLCSTVSNATALGVGVLGVTPE